MLLSGIRSALVALILIPGLAWADELDDLRARNAQLETTVEELTLQLAETLSERKALEARLAQALAANDELQTQLSAGAAAVAATSTADTSGAAAAPIDASAPAPERAMESEVVEEAVMPEAGPAAAPLQGEEPVSPAVANAACDVEAALSGYKRSSKANRALGDWLRADDHLKVCSTEQLKQIRKAVKFDFLGYEKEVLAMIDEELEAR